MNRLIATVLTPFRWSGRCTRLAYWWRVVVLNLTALFTSLFLFESALTADEAASLSDTWTMAAIYLVLALSLLIAPPMALLTIPLILFLVGQIFFAMALGHALRDFPTALSEWEATQNLIWFWLFLHVLLGLTVRLWALSARRLRDAGHDPVYLIFCSIPLLGWLLAPCLLCAPSQPEEEITPDTTPETA